MGPSSLDRSRALGAYGATIGLCLSNSAVPVRRTPAAADLQRDRDAQDQTGGGSDPPCVNDDRKGEGSPERGDREAYSPGDMQDPSSDPAREDRADGRPSHPPPSRSSRPPPTAIGTSTPLAYAATVVARPELTAFVRQSYPRSSA